MKSIAASGIYNDRIHVRPLFSADRKQSKKQLTDIVTLASENAPYLRHLIEDWPMIVERLGGEPPEDICQSLIDEIHTDQSLEDLKASLRGVKQQIHLLLALCDLGGVWDWVAVTHSLSVFADRAMEALIEVLAREMEFVANERGPVPGLFVLALGKYGARELNYSSDIDLIVFYDPDHIQLPDPNKAERTLVRFVQKLMRGFDETTPDGYVFRTDLRLRPDPRSNSVAISTVTAERYYETLGQNWERAAMIKARVCGGDKNAGEDFIKHVLTPYIWRRSLDYAAIADIHSIKRQIQAGAKREDISAPGHNVKLGIGGIREIEFYAQVQQLILGGRHKILRSQKTLEALERLTENNYVDPAVCNRLKSDYATLRDLEHRIQMQNDEQTHDWPKSLEKRNQLSALCHTEDLSDFEDHMQDLFLRVHSSYSALFPEEEDLSGGRGSLVFTGVEPEQPTLDTLSGYGFERGPEVWRNMADWLGGRIPATRTPRARELLTRLAPRIIENCGATDSPDTAFFTFSEFVGDLNAGVTLFSMFVNKPSALASLIEMLAIAPQLGRKLSGQPALIDAMIEPDFLIRKLATEPNYYAALTSDTDDFETAMNAVRRAVHEDQFSLMASLLKLQNVQEAGREFSAVAEAALCALLPVAAKETRRLYGPISGEYAVIGFGKLGGREMTLSSDLDIILIYDIDEEGSDDVIFNKLTRRVVTALSSVTEEGDLYEVDMALRPSGRSGPLAVRHGSFQNYYENNAWTWEFMALSRARVVAASSTAFSICVADAIQGILRNKKFGDKLKQDVLDMHGRLKRDKPSQGPWDIKSISGGVRDIEFITQYISLKHKNDYSCQSTVSMLEQAASKKWLSTKDTTKLIENSKFFNGLQQLIASCAEDVVQADGFPRSVQNLLTQYSGLDSFAELEIAIKTRTEQVRKVFKSVFNVET